MGTPEFDGESGLKRSKTLCAALFLHLRHGLAAPGVSSIAKGRRDIYYHFLSPSELVSMS